jgi:hypothetical protein
MNLAIMPLIQVATLPRLMMRTPERLTLTLPRSMLVHHFVLSICKSRERTDRVRQLQNKCVIDGRLPDRGENSLFFERNSLFARINSLFCCVGNLIVTR